MSLKETERKIYQREGEPDSSVPVQPRSLNPHMSDENPFVASALEDDLEKKKEVWVQEEEKKEEKRKGILKKISIIFGVVVIVVGVVWLALYIRKSAFSEDQVKISISGPEKVKSGDTASFQISYQNLNRASLKNAVVYIKYSENF
ncbi:MAG: hypothetical protein WC643_03160, partial [Parcubacteria group bacterium]